MPAGKWTFDNPVIAKELRGRMRGPRAYWMLFGYLSLLSVSTLLSYYAWWRSHASELANGAIAGSFTAGREFYMILFAVQACLVALIAPALTSGAISIEREQRTLEMLQCTTLRPRALVAGKLVASLSYVILLLTSSIPLISLCFLLGGVSPEEVGAAYLMLICDAFFFGSVALCWSVYAANTVTSVILSYLTLVVYFCVTLPLGLAGLFGGFGMGRISLVALNPVGAMAATSSESWYGAHAPAWGLAVLVNGGLALLACRLGVHRLEDEAIRRTFRLRCYLFAVIMGLIVVVDGGNLGVLTGGAGADRMAVLGAVGLGALLLFLPPLVTGEARDLDPPYGAQGWRWLTFDVRDVFRTASLRAVFPTAVVTTLAASAASAIAWMAWRKVVSGAFRIPHLAVILAPSLALLLSASIFIAGIGLFLSVLLRNRWGALCLSYVAIFLAMVAPAIAYLSVDNEDAARVAHDPGIYLMYLSPVTAVAEAVQTFDPAPYNKLALGPYLAGYGHGMVWAISSVLYVLLAAVLAALAHRIHARRAAGERVRAAKADKTNAAA
ncbi:hypothetical protein CCAX7_29390 [Capsulimonas corticalis]|uniref:Uncharacterized protein n=1 Tax=Capsulimonas corticalis TaxID=2219043 RepID=A0A402CT08_9BACT|nr:ABC transporter permease [Capsulimonas corticalis]BDI30888.1 hypothetical protein CCAX7_29390 [Capsulimonas corticalis]